MNQAEEMEIGYQKTKKLFFFESLVRSRSREKDIKLHRNITAGLLRYTNKFTLQQIATMLNRQDHTTVMHLVSNYDNYEKLPTKEYLEVKKLYEGYEDKLVSRFTKYLTK